MTLNRSFGGHISGGLIQALVLAGVMIAQCGRAAPPNDNFADRIPLSGARVTATGSNIGATFEPGEPTGGTFNSPAVEKTVWWTWTAPADGGLAATVIDSDFFVVVNIHTGYSVSNLTRASGDPWGPAGHPPHQTTARVTAGTSYQIAVGSIEGGSGSIVLELAFVPRAANDDFQNRIALGSGNARAEASTFGATTEPVEWNYNPGSPYGTLWWSWTAAESGPVVFQVAGVTPVPADLRFGFSPTYTTLHIFVGEHLESLTHVTNWSASGEFAPPLTEVSLDAVAGTTYHVSMGGEPGHLGQIEFAIAKTSPPAVILTRLLDGAEFIVGTPVHLAAEAVDFDGSVTGVEFFARDWSEGIKIMQGDVARPFRGVLTNLPPGTYSAIARATDDSGMKSDSIPVEFNVRPVNDAFARRIPFTGAFVTVTGTLANASTETGEPSGSGRPNVWWEWTAPTEGAYTLTAMPDAGEIVLQVFTGASLATLTPVQKLSVGPDRAFIQAGAGALYAIRISNFGSRGPCALQVAQTEPPVIALISPTNEMRIFEGNTVTLSAEASDSDGSISRVEFFDVFSESLGSVSDEPFALTLSFLQGYYSVYAVATDNHGVSTRSERVTLRVLPTPPANDAFAMRLPFTGSFITVTGDTASATLEPGEEFFLSEGSAWWEWTASEPGVHSITVTSANWPSVAVFAGTEIGTLSLVTNASRSGDMGHSALVTIQAAAGERYQIAAASRGVVRVSVARTLPPTVRISDPANDASFVVGQTVQVRAEASDPDGTIDRVEFYSDGGSLYATLTNEPFVLALPLTYARYHQFQARAFDDHGVAASSSSVRFLAREPGPVNDAFANRIPLAGSFLSVTGSAANATLEPEEPYWGLDGSAWWEWTAPESGAFTIGVKGENNYWLSMAVFTGNDLSGLTLITNRINHGSDLEYFSQFVIEAQAGVSYSFAVSPVSEPIVLFVAQTTPPTASILQPAPNSFFFPDEVVTLQAGACDADGAIRSVEFFLNGALFATVTNEPFVLQTTFREGPGGHIVRVRVTDNQGVSTFSDYVPFEVRFRPPANDQFASRTPLTGWFVTLDAADWEATREPGEPAPDEGQGSVWWRWTAPASGRVTLSCERSYTYIAACVGTKVTELDVVAATGPASFLASQLEFDAEAGVDYAIVFQSLSGSVGSFRMSLVLDAYEMLGPRMLSPVLFAFDLRTTLERTWIVEATTNLVDWAPVAAGRCADGTLEFVDPIASGHPRRFYRAVAER